jgi:hypothetical protein
MTGDGPAPPHPDAWDDLRAEAETLAASLRDQGWTVVTAATTSVAAVDDQPRTGFFVDVPTAQIDAIRDHLESGATIEAADVYYHTTARTTYALVVERDDTNDVAVLVPMYYDLDDARPLLETGVDHGRLLIYLQGAETDQSVAFSHDEPSLFIDDDVVDWDLA